MYKLGKDIIAPIYIYCYFNSLSSTPIVIFFQYRLSVTNAKGGII